MEYYKDNINQVYAYDKTDMDGFLIREDLIPITEAEALKIASPIPSKQQLIVSAEYKKKSAFNEASIAIAPLQDAIDLGIATDKELKQLNAWKQYRVDLNRIDTANAPDIAWPEKPQ